jgi:hypothetical protein
VAGSGSSDTMSLMTIPAEHQHQLDELGYVILPGFMGPELLERLRRRVDAVFEEEQGRAGSEFKQEPGCRRLANLVDKELPSPGPDAPSDADSGCFREVLTDRRLLGYVEHVLGPEYKLSSMNVRSVDPHNGITQPLHADMGALPDERGYWVFNSVWMLDDFMLENGPLRVIPGSHRWGTLPPEGLTDPHPDEQLVTGQAGTVLVMNAHLWHGGLANRTDRPRTALHAFFCRRDKPQQQYQKHLVRPKIQQSLDPFLRWLLALDDPLNDAVSANPKVRSGFLK